MKTPWINHSKMQKICSKQMIIFKYTISRVQNKSLDMNFFSINEKGKETEKDVCKLDSEQSCDHINETNNPNKNEDMNNLLHEKKHTDSTNDLSELTDGIDSENVSKVDEFIETDTIFELADSTDCKFNTKPANETKDKPLVDFTIEPLRPSESDVVDEINELIDKEEIEETPTADETNYSSQTDHTNEFEHPSESNVKDEINELIDKEEIEETHPADETNYSTQTDHTNEFEHPSESNVKDEINELFDKEDGEETYPEDEMNYTSQTDHTIEFEHPSESDLVDEINELFDKEEIEETHTTDEMRDFFNNEVKDEPYPTGNINGLKYGQGKVTKKSPFSIHVEIDDFLHAPICGDILQNTFEFLDLNNKQTPDLDTKLSNTTTYYPEQPECCLVCSNIHEIVFLSDNQNEGNNSKGNQYKSVAVPLHDSQFTKGEESNNNSYVHIRVPVILGEYKIEISLEENITFKEEIMRIQEISKEIILTNFKLVPTVLSPLLNNGTSTVLKGILLIEGHICQEIEYSVFLNKNTEYSIPLKQLNQKMVVELIIQILQDQKVRVKR